MEGFHHEDLLQKPRCPRGPLRQLEADTEQYVARLGSMIAASQRSKDAAKGPRKRR